jgi:transposase InsO family protein
MQNTLSTLCNAIEMEAPPSFSLDSGHLSNRNSIPSISTKPPKTSNFINTRVNRQLPKEQRKINRDSRRKRKAATIERTSTLEPQNSSAALDSPSSNDLEINSISPDGTFSRHFNDDDDDRNYDDDGGITSKDKDKLTFGEWLERKRMDLDRKHNIITNEQHELLVSIILNDPHHPPPLIIADAKEKIWAENLIPSLGLTVIQQFKNDTLVNILVQPKFQLDAGMMLAPNSTNQMIFKYYRIIPRFSEIESILSFTHCNIGHAAWKTLYSKIQQQYLYITRDMCKEIKLRCTTCSRTAAITGKGRKPVTPIDGKETFHHMQLDLIDYRSTPAGPNGEFHYVAHLIDHFSTFHVTEALQQKSGEEILHFLRKTFSFTGFPVILHTDNGSEFINNLVINYLEQHGVKYVHGKPYKPTTQGKVERANRTLKEMMVKLVTQSKFKKTWYDVLYEATLAVNTNLSSVIKKSPYEHIFCMTPINDGNITNYQSTLKTIQKQLVNEQDEKVDYNNNESPEFDMNFGNMDIVQQIRQDSRKHYERNLKRMKLTHDRLRKVRIFEVGDVAAVIVPKEYAVQEANKLPVMVAKVDIYNDERVYTLVYDDFLIDSKYFQHELVSLVSYEHYYDAVGQRFSEGYIEEMKGKLEKSELQDISLQSAYIKYIEILHATAIVDEGGESNAGGIDEGGVRSESKDDKNNNDTVSDDETATMEVVEMSSPLKALVTKYNPSEKKLVNIVLDAKMCAVCKEKINSTDYVTCYECGRKMHDPGECQFGMVQYTYRNKKYCSIACHLGQENYELRIIKEDTLKKRYLIEYRNGQTSYLAAKRVESLAQYTKMVHDWRKKHPAISEYVEDDDYIEILTSYTKVSASPNSTNNINNGSVCCVCNEELTKDNPHACYGCKRRMHGHIICPQRHLIYTDDDKLYCNVCNK